MTIYELADDFLTYWESYEANGKTHYKLKTETITQKPEYLDLLVNCLDESMSSYSRDFVHDALCYISDHQGDSLEDLRGELTIEPDVYTSDLTDWLADNINHVQYLDDAMELGVDNGLNLLAIAQQRHKEEIAHNTIDTLVEYLQDSKTE